MSAPDQPAYKTNCTHTCMYCAGQTSKNFQILPFLTTYTFVRQIRSICPPICTLAHFDMNGRLDHMLSACPYILSLHFPREGDRFRIGWEYQKLLLFLASSLHVILMHFNTGCSNISFSLVYISSSVLKGGRNREGKEKVVNIILPSFGRRLRLVILRGQLAGHGLQAQRPL